MSYLVLARKWRPLSFDTLVGQDHVVRALSNALNTGRLHHAWLFTGTRGVGKTTLSRILAKSLNCETGITANPCGKCRACVEISQGRFVDYMEFDAASNRGVDDMAQLLDQAVYAPSVGRFKIYMIDEVHMLTGHAFNAMLKTLEEPPEHVKFILATTDPQKIPVTVLSRCLQFNLKQMPPESIVSHLQYVLGQESIAYDVPALRLIGQAAAGSMRDALSLTDQAIAYSGSNLTADAVRDMLGTVDQKFLVRLLQSLLEGSAKAVIAVADELNSRGFSYTGALADLSVLLSKIAIEQRLSGSVSEDDPLASDIATLAQQFHPDVLQLFYSIAVNSRTELAYAPDEYAGFVMACLRMLSLTSGELVKQEIANKPSLHRSSSSSTQSAAVANVVVSESSQTEPIQAAVTPVAATVSSVEHAPVQIESSVQEVTAPDVKQEQELVPSEPALAEVAVNHAVQVEQAATIVNSINNNSSAVDNGSAAKPEEPSVELDSTASTSTTQAPVTTADQTTPAWELIEYSESEESLNSEISLEQNTDEALVSPLAENPEALEKATVAHEFLTPADEDEADAEPGNWVLLNEEPTGQFTNDMDIPYFDEPASAAIVQNEEPESLFTLAQMNEQTWPQLAADLQLSGIASELARQSAWGSFDSGMLTLRVFVKSFTSDLSAKVKLETALTEYFKRSVRVKFIFAQTGDSTAHAVAQGEIRKRQEQAEVAVNNDSWLNSIKTTFNAQVLDGSIKPA